LPPVPLDLSPPKSLVLAGPHSYGQLLRAIRHGQWERRRHLCTEPTGRGAREASAPAPLRLLQASEYRRCPCACLLEPEQVWCRIGNARRMPQRVAVCAACRSYPLRRRRRQTHSFIECLKCTATKLVVQLECRWRGRHFERRPQRGVITLTQNWGPRGGKSWSYSGPFLVVADGDGGREGKSCPQVRPKINVESSFACLGERTARCQPASPSVCLSVSPTVRSSVLSLCLRERAAEPAREGETERLRERERMRMRGICELVWQIWQPQQIRFVDHDANENWTPLNRAQHGAQIAGQSLRLFLREHEPHSLSKAAFS